MPVLAILIAAPQSIAGETLTAIPGGTFTMGDTNETPRRMTVVPFRVSAHEVTNREFADFVAATGHATDPERLGEGYVWTDKWRSMKGAD
jgi:formylglycine-generating enzyme required for sulfatase activity